MSVTSRYRWAILAAGVFAQGALSALQQGLPALGPLLRDENGLSLAQVGVVFACVSWGITALLLGWGANVWGQGALLTGLVAAALIVPVFAYRHFVRDKGRFPESMYETGADGAVIAPTKRAGALPYLVLAGGVVMVVLGQLLATT